MSSVKDKLKAKAGDGFDDLVLAVQDDPDYFLDQGGTEGTSSHAKYLEQYSKYEPELAEFAKAVLHGRD
jgi:hypothetical protein